MEDRIRNIFKKFLILLLLLISMFIISGCSNKNENLLNEKINSEIEYMEKCIISMLNSFNNISYTNYKMETEINKNDDTTIVMIPNGVLLNKDNKIDWDNLKFEIENIYSTWNNLFIDLNSNGVGNKETLEFSKILNDVTISIKNENKSETINNLSNLYSEIIKYVKQYTNDDLRINVLETKSFVLNSYVSVTNENWNIAKTNINLASEKFGNVINNITKNENKQASINKAYVYIKESEKAIDIKDRDIFYIYYKLLMQELDNI